jgi:hypothetical protein
MLYRETGDEVGCWVDGEVSHGGYFGIFTLTFLSAGRIGV